MKQIELDKIVPSPEPIRRIWKQSEMETLAESVKKHGVIVPIKVREVEDQQYEIIYGHRRAEASRRAGKNTIPALLEHLEETEVLSQAILENLQREDMTLVDKVIALQRYKDETGKSNQEIADDLGMSRSWVTEHLILTPEELDFVGGIDHQKQREKIGYSSLRKTRSAGQYQFDLLQAAAEGRISNNITELVKRANALERTPSDEAAREIINMNPYRPHKVQQVIMRGIIQDDFDDESDRFTHISQLQKLGKFKGLPDHKLYDLAEVYKETDTQDEREWLANYVLEEGVQDRETLEFVVRDREQTPDLEENDESNDVLELRAGLDGFKTKLDNFRTLMFNTIDLLKKSPAATDKDFTGILFNLEALNYDIEREVEKLENRDASKNQ